MERRLVTICLTDFILENQKKEHFSFDDWVYLGYSYKTFLTLEKIFGQSILMSTFHKSISHKTEELRTDYIQYFTQISRNNKSIYWHFSKVAENNPTDNNFFMDFCYYSICLDILKKNNISLLIIIDNDILFHGLIRELKLSKHLKLSIYPKYKFSSFYLNIFLRRFVNQVRSVMGLLKSILFRKVIIWIYWIKQKSKSKSNNNVLLFTFVNDSCFGSGGKFNERYFGALNTYLKDSNYNIIYLLHTAGYSHSKFLDIIKWCKTSDSSFIFIEQKISLKDVIASLLVMFSLLKTKLPVGNICGIDPSYLIRKELRKECFSSQIRNPYFNYAIIKNLSKETDSTFNHFFYPYGGSSFEKAFNFSCRKYMPECKIIAFSHGAFSKNHISYLLPIKNKRNDFLPDHLFCPGEVYKNIFVGNGFDKVTIVGDLRQYSPDNANNNLPFQTNKDIILVALPLTINEAQELFWKVINAYNNTEHTVKIYKHPMMEFDILNAMIEGSIPQNINIVDEPTSSGLDQCYLVVTTGSTVSVNALGRGLPVISVKRSIGLTFEPMDWFDSPIIYCEKPEDILRATEKIFSMSKKDLESYRIKAINIAGKFLDQQINHSAIAQCLSSSSGDNS